MLLFRRAAVWLVAAVTPVSVLVMVAPVAHAAIAQATVVSAVPAAYTPDISDGVVYAINQVNWRIIVGGDFTTESNHGSSTVLKQPRVFAFDARTGVLDTGFRPVVDGDVRGIEPGPTANTAYLAGSFKTVDGVTSRSITLISTTTGARVAGFTPPVLNGMAYTVKRAGARVYVGGSFGTAGGVAHHGLVALDAATGKLSPYVDVQLAGHHNYAGSGASGSIGTRAMSISPDGRSLIVIGNFKTVDGVTHDQIVWVDLSGATTAVVRPDWNTSRFTAACLAKDYDTYMRGIDWAPDGSYFVVTATGGSGTNSDGTRALCDSAARFEAASSGANVAPTWVDYSGQDTLLTVAITGTAVYVGGHQRWLNNANGFDAAQAGAVPRPGLAALDPANGLPLAWNPGRNPRGAGVYGLFASATGLYVGSDTDYFGDRRYVHDKLGFFPLAGGTTLAPTTTASLPANVFQAGALTSAPNTYSTGLSYRRYDGTTVGVSQPVASPASIDWSATRGAFMVNNTIFYGTANGSFRSVGYTGYGVGTPVGIDPYDDPAWANVQTGSGQTYRGLASAYYGQLKNVTGAFYSAGRLYYSLAGDPVLHDRYFTPNSGIVGGSQFDVGGGDFSDVAGEFLSGTSLYYADGSDGTLHEVSFAGGAVSGPDTVVSGPGLDGTDWRARSLFLYPRP